jgi:hypothetical protein
MARSLAVRLVQAAVRVVQLAAPARERWAQPAVVAGRSRGQVVFS